MFPGNRLGAVLFWVLILLLLGFVAIAMYLLGSQNARLEAENNQQNDLIQQLILQNRGPRGDDGLSAYEIWLSLGNTGSEQDFIDSLRGKPGTNGIDGRDGASGKSGPSGAPVGSVVCNGTSISFYSTTGAHLGNVNLVCIR